MKIGIDLSFSVDPSYSLKLLKVSENAGFDSLWLGDHFMPWHHSFKQSFFVWPVMAIAAARTRTIPVGVDVTVPIGGRYHPAIVAQAIGTLSAMYPGRILLGVGSGEAVSEKRFMQHWPSWNERTQRLAEAVEFMRRLWVEKDFFDFDGRYFRMKNAFLYVKPKKPVPIYFSAIGEKASYYAGKHGDHIMTVNTWQKCKDTIFPAFERGAREAGKDPKRMEKTVVVGGGVGNTNRAIRRIRRYLAGALIGANFREDDPRKIEESQNQVTDEMILKNYCLSETADELIEAFDRYRRVGVSHVIFMDFSSDEKRTTRIFKRKVIPYFKSNRRIR